MFTSHFDMSSLGNKPQLKERAPGNLWEVCPRCRPRTGEGTGEVCGLPARSWRWAAGSGAGSAHVPAWGPCGAGAWPGVPVWAPVPAQPRAG